MHAKIKTMSNYLSREAAVGTIKKFFHDEPADVINVDDLFIKMARDLNKGKANRSWLSNKLTSLKEYNFLEKHYSAATGKKKLTRLSLTSEGKRALGRVETQQISKASYQLSPSLSTKQNNEADVEALLEWVNRNIDLLQAKLPSFVITFNIQPKRELGAGELMSRALKKM